MNSYEENEMRKVGAKVQFCDFALCVKPARFRLFANEFLSVVRQKKKLAIFGI